jgi:hypothetical protein
LEFKQELTDISDDKLEVQWRYIEKVIKWLGL